MRYHETVITFATLPKPFLGHIGIIQRNAIQSWLQMSPRPRVMLFGNEEGTAEVAREFGIDHVPSVACNEYGTPYLYDVFRILEQRSSDHLLCYSNCDIILFPDLLESAKDVAARFDRFLLVGECTNLDVREPITFSPAWQHDLRTLMNEKGKRRGINADYFVFTRGSYPSAPPSLVLGRAYFDNWIIYEARRMKTPVVDATRRITAIHQNHRYAAVPGETAESHNGFEAMRNLDVIGGKPSVYWIPDRTHFLTARGLQRDILGTLLLKRRWNGIVKSTKYRIIDSLRALGLHE